MQKQIHIHLQNASPKLQKLGVVELRLQQVIEGNLCAGAGHRNCPVTPLDAKDAHFVARQRNVQLRPLPLGVPAPRDDNAPVRQVRRRVLE